MNTTTETKSERIINFIESVDTTGMYLTECYNDGDSFEQFEESVQRRINETEIIYYYRAIEYLSENDPSLEDSLELASMYGYDCTSLNSEILATILNQEYLRNQFAEIAGEIEDFFNEIENEDEDEDE